MAKTPIMARTPVLVMAGIVYLAPFMIALYIAAQIVI